MNRRFTISGLWSFCVCVLLFLGFGMNRLHAQGGTGPSTEPSSTRAATPFRAHSCGRLGVPRRAQRALKRRGQVRSYRCTDWFYTVEISAPGFTTIQRPIAIAAGTDQAVPVELSIVRSLRKSPLS